MARPARPAAGTRPGPPPLIWRRATFWFARSLWLRATWALAAAYVLILPLAIVAAAQEQQAAAAAARALSEGRLQDDLGDISLGLAREDASVRGHVLTGDPALGGDYDLGRRQAESAWTAATADARDSGLAGELPPVRAAMDGWQVWAAGIAQRAATPSVPEVGALPQGTRLLESWHAAAGRLDAVAGSAAARDGARSDALYQLALRDDVLGPLMGNGAIVLLGSILVAVVLRPVSRLAGVAARLAGGARAAVPYTDRANEIGSLARALTRWQRSEASRRAILEHSPAGLFTVGSDLQLVDVNPAVRAMFGIPMGGVSFASLDSFVHPDGLGAVHELRRQLASGTSDLLQLEQRFLRADGGVFWGSLTVAVVRGADGSPGQFVCMIEDVSERRERLERAARVQRDLLPESAPELEGYELAGICRPSQDMSADFFDWYRHEPGGLTVTLGDVMGKDMPAALLMAIVRIALRTSAAQPTVDEAVRMAAVAVGRDLERAGAFVTLFTARLDAGSGAVTYVDAGHGLALVVGGAGVRRLERGASPPLGVLEGERYEESAVTLEPGDALVVFSDGVLDVHPELEERMESAGELLSGATSAGEMVERLASGPGTATDDVTVVVLRRRPLLLNR